MNTKTKILISALNLFNTQGVEGVTTRHIATDIGISQGNLHYHYATKNIILECLFQDFLIEVKNAERFTGNGFEKETVYESMRDNFIIMFKYRFLFKDNEVVWRRLPNLKKTTIELFSLKQQQIFELIQLYRSAGIFRNDISDKQIRFLTEQFIFSITSWLSASEYNSKENDICDFYTKYTFRLWFPYLKPTEMKIWEKVLLKY